MTAELDPDERRIDVAAIDADATPPADGDTTESAPAEPVSEDDRWHRFADTADAEPPEEPAGRVRRVLRGTGRVAAHEWTVVAAFSLVLAVAMTWPVMRDPMHTIPHDTIDPLLQTYLIAWGGDALIHNPEQFWDNNSFYPESDSNAFTDNLLGFAPAGMLGSGPEAALLRYNVMYVLAFALTLFGAYALLRQLGARRTGALVAAAAVAYAPWRLAHGGHLNILSVGGIMLALAMLARGHGWSLRGGYRVERTRWRWVIGGWLVATWQLTIGFGMAIPFAYLLLAIGLAAVIGWLIRRPRVPWPILAANAVGGLIFAGTALALAVPYLRVRDDHPEAIRTWDYLEYFSPSWSSFLIAPEESSLWGGLHEDARAELLWPPETTLLVGVTLLALALVGLVWSCWTIRQRVFLVLGTAVSVALAMGPNFLDNGAWAYRLAFDYLPGFDAIRTSGRLVLYTTLLLAILAAGTLTRLAERAESVAEPHRVDPRAPVRVSIPLRVAFLLPLVVVLAEGVTSADVEEVPRAPVAMSELDYPMMVLPSDVREPWVQYWTTDGFGEIVNGSAAFTPDSLTGLREATASFPSPQAVAALREAGVDTVLVVRDYIPGTPWQSALDTPVADSSITVTDHGAAVVFDIGTR